MKKLIVILIATMVLFTTAYACTAFKSGETVSGMNKICYYDHLGSTVAFNVKSHQLCPLTIQVAH